ncbi:MAG: GDP-mannose mannosyl hydrolase [Bacteroidales bacterium]|nr:GDP-mannose mannosyl hydrolase [Bacteroidales bacterium]
MLSKKDFLHIVKHTPLISIDLILENKKGEVLLGWRSNLPAKDRWFVPGGRIRKDEKFQDAFSRIVREETGMDKTMEEAEFYGVYQHFYPGENFAAEPGIGTHYIVVAFRLRLEQNLNRLPKDQHTDYWWAPVEELLSAPDVHLNTKDYFNGKKALSTSKE